MEPESRKILDSGLACVALIARFHGLAADSAQLDHRFGRPGEPFGAAEILRASKTIGLKARATRGDWAALERAALPAIAQRRDGRFFIVGRCAKGRVLIQDPSEEGPRSLDRAEFMTLWSGDLILVTRRARLFEATRRFEKGFKPLAVRWILRPCRRITWSS